MRIIALLLLILASFQSSALASGRIFELAKPGYKYSFPKDHASHEHFKTEWWYYTGNLKGEDGNQYGYELTFFRSALDLEKPIQNSIWAMSDIYMAHFAVTDVNAKQFYTKARLQRPGPEFAGSSKDKLKVWNLNWSATMEANEKQLLKAKSSDCKLELELTPQKPLVIQGENGISRKASKGDHASHYYSYTKLKTEGLLTIKGKRVKVSGTSWMDHEFGSNQLNDNQVGWDWFSIHLDNNREIMLYLMRLDDGSYDSASSGSLISESGKLTHLKLSDYKIKSVGKWKSDKTKIEYPMGWQIDLPAFNVHLKVSPKIHNQEFQRQEGNAVTYWEGACSVLGTYEDKTCKGDAYVEMTGYGDAFKLKI
ncbi:MAG: carotenoid 1,2-hydratase [Cyanobacteria bacterium TGS_CYA1]|nr:carotenoid 1,2-hydratase [Cyanobacteria bacterium TGS_CYA1]